MKLLSFAVPCYNSAAYMDKCIESLLPAGDDVEIILVNDGSKDNTAEIADAYAAKYPDIIRVIHQENGGHGEGVNQGVRHARGLYYKVVDSDDWLDIDALRTLMTNIRAFALMPEPIDAIIANYVYEHSPENTQKVMRYTNVFPTDRIFGWQGTRRFFPSQYLLMHSVIYRTQLLRDCALELPKHTFYVDNIFVFQPLPFVKTLYYLNVDLYRYFIGRADQSVNESVMITRADQQVRVTRLMLESFHKLRPLIDGQRKLRRYMINYLAMMMSISSIFLILADTPESLKERDALWRDLVTIDRDLAMILKYRSFSAFANFPGYQGRRLTLSLYRIARRIYKFN